MKDGRRLSLGRLAACVGLGIGALVLAVGLVLLLFGGAILNGYGKKKLERAFAAAYPGYALRIGELGYTVRANRLVAQTVTLSTANSALKVGPVSLAGVRWVRLLWGHASLADVLSRASLEATNLELDIPHRRYGIRCARLQASVPDSELVAEGAEIRPLVGDEQLFATSAFRTTRFRMTVPECSVSGLAFGDLLQGTSYRARSVLLSRPFLDALVNRDKPVNPSAEPPLMVHEALAAIRQPLQVDRLTITGGHLKYGERVVAGAVPGVLTVGALNATVEGIANRGGAAAAIVLRAQGDLMSAGALKAVMTIPVASPDLSLHYSGSVGAMDLTHLNAFLAIAEHTRIKSGSLQGAAFEIAVTAGHASGHVRGIYKDLTLALLDTETGSAKGLANRFESFLTNAFRIRSSNAPDASGPIKEGEVNYTRRPSDEFQQFAWFALRSGVLNLISR